MPLFSIQAQKIESVSQTNFGSEKELQLLVEKNLETVFSCRFVASEFATGARHARRARNERFLGDPTVQISLFD